jgi:hypothetical protein
VGFRAKTVVLLSGVCLVSGLGAACASATIRYAAPGGQTDPAQCLNPTPTPCTIYAAAKGPGVVVGDQVVVEPGNYSDDDMSATGDLGPTGSIASPSAANIHGVTGQPRPVITLNNVASAGFGLAGTLSHVEIDTAVRSLPIYLGGTGSVADDIVVRSSVAGAGATACYILQGILRDSACLATGAGARAAGSDGSGTTAPQLRNVTAISSGTGATTGISFSSPSGSAAASVKATIARAPSGADVMASESGTGNASIAIDHSNYVTVSDQGGLSPVTDGGGHQTGAPSLAADGYHELPNSAATVNLGLGGTDGSTGSTDIDGQFRSIEGTDIGADELGHATSTTLDCAPASLLLGSGSSSCHVLVTDTDPIPGGPAGTVTFSSSGPGSFSSPSCILDPVGIGFRQGECTIAYTPSGAGTHQLGGAYTPGDQLHEASHGSSPLAVTGPPATASSGAGAGKKKCKKHRRLKHGKCVKKKRKR